jgi:hypothetical protein
MYARRPSPRTSQSDDLRHSAILQQHARPILGHGRRYAGLGPAAAVIAGSAGAPPTGSCAARPAPLRGGRNLVHGRRLGRSSVSPFGHVASRLNHCNLRGSSPRLQ